MNRFFVFVFVFGALVGAVGVFFLFNRGHLSPGDQRNAASPQGSVVVADDATGDALPPPDIAAPTNVLAPPPVREAFTPAPVAVDPMLPGTAPVPVPGATPASAAATGLLIPVLGVSAGQLADTYTQRRGAGRLHDAIDIIAPRGTPVGAVDDGKVVKLFNSKPGGLTVYQFDRDGKLPSSGWPFTDRRRPGGLGYHPVLSTLPWRERLAISGFGVRGIGSFYYLAFALNQGWLPMKRELWATVSFVVLLSILMHSLAATSMMQYLDSRRSKVRRNG